MDKSASEHDIKKAYKRLSRRYHPDKNHEPDAENKFVEVAHGESLPLKNCDPLIISRVAAYEILSDTTVSHTTTSRRKGHVLTGNRKDKYTTDMARRA